MGCTKEDDSLSENGETAVPEYVVPTIIPSGEENYLNEGSSYIFDQDTLRTFELKLPRSALSAIDANPAAEQYVEGSLIFEGDTISPIGIRYKGSVGAFVNCVSGNNWADPSGYKTCTKLSMKVKINWKDREEKFYKLRKLQFHSQNNDPSQMHERLGYWLFREMGVPAPRSVHAKLKINDIYIGVFALTEQIDGRFVKRNFDDDEGNLYKEIWPLSMDGVPYSHSHYLNALKTNGDNNPNVDFIRNFGQKVADAEILEYRNVVEESMDIEEVISYVVVDRTIKHDDGPFHWYCFGDDCSNHNFYFYEEPNNKKLRLIPWDLDNAFENIIDNANPVTPIADDWGMISNDCKPFKHSFFGIEQWSASCDKLTAIWALYDDEFKEMKNKLINGPMSANAVNEVLDKWSNQIRDATSEASLLHDDAISIDKWESEMTKLREQLEYARNN